MDPRLARPALDEGWPHLDAPVGVLERELPLHELPGEEGGRGGGRGGGGARGGGARGQRARDEGRGASGREDGGQGGVVGRVPAAGASGAPRRRGEMRVRGPGHGEGWSGEGWSGEGARCGAGRLLVAGGAVRVWHVVLRVAPHRLGVLFDGLGVHLRPLGGAALEELVALLPRLLRLLGREVRLRLLLRAQGGCGQRGVERERCAAGLGLTLASTSRWSLGGLSAVSPPSSLRRASA